MIIKRQNMVEFHEKAFKPPLHSASKGILARCLNYLRQFLDLQFGSISRDLAHILPQVVGVVLDIGCGAQPFRKFFHSEKVKYIGIDIKDSDSKFGYHQPDTVYYSDTTLPAESNTADFILCTETLEHILEPSWMLNEMWRCLKKGGNILLTVPFSARWHFIPFDYWRYTPSSLSHLLIQSGFIDIKIYARGNALTVACYKAIGLMLPFLFFKGNNKLRLILTKFVGVLLLPFVFLFALIANISINQTKGSEDCLGFTVIASKQ